MICIPTRSLPTPLTLILLPQNETLKLTPSLDRRDDFPSYSLSLLTVCVPVALRIRHVRRGPVIERHKCPSQKENGTQMVNEKGGSERSTTIFIVVHSAVKR